MATIEKFTPPQDSNSLKLGYDEASGVVRIYVPLEKNNTNNNITIKKIMKNDDYTTVLWEDGTHTVVKKMVGEVNDPEKALLFALLKKLCNNNGSKMTRYLEDAEDKTIVKSKDPNAQKIFSMFDNGYPIDTIAKKMRISVSDVKECLEKKYGSCLI